jgi:histidinol phosphatase-like enzyme
MAEKAELRKKLTAFYTRYAPADVAKVELALSIAKPETDLWAHLYKKYAVNPTEADSVIAAASGDKPALRRKLLAFYQRFAPGDIGKVDLAVRIAKPEADLWAHLTKKYGIDPAAAAAVINGDGDASLSMTASAVASPVASPERSMASPTAASQPALPFMPMSADRDEFRRRVTAFYTRYSPADVAKVDAAMQLTRPELEIWSHLFQKYKAAPAEAIPYILTAAAAAAPQQQPLPPPAQPAPAPPSAAAVGASPTDKEELRRKLTAFYTRYAPSDMSKVDHAMRIDTPEAALWAHLYNKYAVNPTEADAILAAHSQQQQPPAASRDRTPRRHRP